MKKPELTEEELEIFEMLKANNLYEEILNFGYILGRSSFAEENLKKDILTKSIKNIINYTK